MKIGEIFKKQYIENLKSYLPQEIVQYSDFQTAVFASLDDLVELSSLEVCEARKKGLALSCDSGQLAERILKLRSGNEFIAGARFKNLSVDFPFIEIQSGFAMSPEYIREISEIIKNEFKNLNPKGLKFRDKPNAHPNLEKWSHTVFGQIEKQKKLVIPLGLHLSFTQNIDWHEQYVTEYQARLAEKNELNGFVRIGKLDEFQESAADQALLVGVDGDGFCGVVAGIKSPLYGLPAVYMIESYLSKRLVGKKVAPLAHAFFLNEMSARFNYVWGTIYEKNLSSLNTALRVGRRIIETEYFFRFD